MFRSAIITAALLSVAVPAQAEPRTLDVEAGEDWVHAATGLRFPARIDDFIRERIVSFMAGESNIGSPYMTSDGDEALTLFVYRSGSYDVSMMADAASAAITDNDRLGSIDRDNGVFSTFGDAGIGEGSGVALSYPVDGELRSTGLALLRSGNWLVKLRLSSKKLDANALDRRIRMLASALAIEPSGQQAPPAYRVADCGDLPSRGEAARRQLDMTDLIIVTTAVSVAYDETVEDKAKDAISAQETARLCRDRKSRPGRMFYREAESGDPRAIVFGDSGMVSHVGTVALSIDEDSAPPVVLSLDNGMRTQFFDGFESIPGFAQIMKTLQDGTVQASVARTQDGSEITLHTSE